MSDINSELLLTQRADGDAFQRKSWLSRTAWLTFDLTVFAMLVIVLG